MTHKTNRLRKNKSFYNFSFIKYGKKFSVEQATRVIHHLLSDDWQIKHYSSNNDLIWSWWRIVHFCKRGLKRWLANDHLICRIANKKSWANTNQDLDGFKVFFINYVLQSRYSRWPSWSNVTKEKFWDVLFHQGGVRVIKTRSP